MEAGGHYYTVYYTSLAVGYRQDIAYQQALLAQMPDQVGWLDASHMQQTEARIPTSMNQVRGKEVDLNNHFRSVTAHDRARIQAGAHALVPNHLSNEIKSSAFQRQFTINKLMGESPASLKFGILLHRLGDSYAHSRIDDSTKMYGISSNSLFTFTNLGESAGHLFDMHDPDYPFLRKNIFFQYLQQLYNVLFNKLNEKGNQQYKRAHYTAVTYEQLQSVFQLIFMNLIRRQKQFSETNFRMACGRGVCAKVALHADNEKIASWYISEMRLALGRIRDITVEAYAPEKQNLMSLREFLNGHRNLSHLNITGRDVDEAINDMIPGGEGSLVPPPAKSLSDKAYDYVKDTEFMRGMGRELQKLTTPPGFRY
jgi:hypothetical protein